MPKADPKLTSETLRKTQMPASSDGAVDKNLRASDKSSFGTLSSVTYNSGYEVRVAQNMDLQGFQEFSTLVSIVKQHQQWLMESMNMLNSYKHKGTLPDLIPERSEIILEETEAEIEAKIATLMKTFHPGRSLFRRFLKSEKISRERTFVDQMVDTRGWYVAKDKWDGIAFEAKRDVLIYGVGVYRQIDGEKNSFNLGYKFQIEDRDGRVLERCDEVVEKDV